MKKAPDYVVLGLLLLIFISSFFTRELVPWWHITLWMGVATVLMAIVIFSKK